MSRLKSIHLEIAILQDLSHYNIIRVHELIELEMGIVIVMPFVTTSTLLQYIQQQRKGTGIWCFPEDTAWCVFRQLISGVEYIQDNLTVHRNLTLDTILFDCIQLRVVITGFCIAEIVAQEDELQQTPLDVYATRQKYFNRSRFINPYFTAPEMLNIQNARDYVPESIYSEGKADIYSCGVILVSRNFHLLYWVAVTEKLKYTMVNGVIPYSGNMLMTQFGPYHAAEHYRKVTNTPIMDVLKIHKGDLDSYNLLVGMLHVSRALRYDIRQTTSHPWMQMQPQTRLTRRLITRKPVATSQIMRGVILGKVLQSTVPIG
jgi:serine/threonine protein kinase